MLTSIAYERTHRAIIHFDRERDFDDTLRKENFLELSVISSFEKLISSTHLSLGREEGIVGRHRKKVMESKIDKRDRESTMMMFYSLVYLLCEKQL